MGRCAGTSLRVEIDIAAHRLAGVLSDVPRMRLVAPVLTVTVSNDHATIRGEPYRQKFESVHSCSMAKTISSLHEVFVDQLKDIYSAETQITKALPKLAKAATNPDLKKGFLSHLEQTKVHVERIKGICDVLKEKPTGKKCAATAGLVEEGQEAIEEDATPETKDVMLIAAARRVEHYEMSAYLSAIDAAKALGLSAAAKTLAVTLREEEATDAKLAKASGPAIAKIAKTA
jgi:ferritin-like metal-binding protein YciE